MTRKDYVLIANCLKNSKPDANLKDMLFAWEVTAATLARTLQDNNPRFDYDRFLTASGLDSL